MDLEAFDTKTRATEGVAFFLPNFKTGEPTDASITIIGQDSDEYVDLKADQERAIIEQVTEKKTRLTNKDAKRMVIELLAKSTKGWSKLEIKGQPLAFSYEAAVQLYTDYPGIRDFLVGEQEKRKNFLRP
jgi:hypothetical protein